MSGLLRSLAAAVTGPRWRRASFALVALTVAVGGLGAPRPASAVAGAAPSPEPALAAADWDVPGGHFFTETRGAAPTGYGFGVVDDADARFWTEFQRLGGVGALGYPISCRFVVDGLVYQAFQKSVLQWRPDLSRATFMSIFEEQSKRGKDDWLEATQEIPQPATFDESGLGWDEIYKSRLSLLDPYPAIKDSYFSVADWLEHNGLPMAPVVDYGSVRVLRAQRAVLQQWMVDTPWAAAGQVVYANAGEIARDAGLVPPEATEPERVPDSISGPFDPRQLPDRGEVPDSELQKDLEQYVATLQGTYGIAAYSFATGQTVRINDGQFYPSASLYKLVGLYEAYRQVRAGRIQMGTQMVVSADDASEDEISTLAAGDTLTVADALRLMITVSSNAAAHTLFDKLGWDSFNDAASRLRLGYTRMPVGAYREQQTGWRREDASTSPGDVMRFLQMLGRRQLVDPAASDEMLSLLLDQQINDRIPAGLPPGVRVAHKTGDLDGVRNDAGIVYSGSSAYALVVLSMDADEEQATAAIAEIARRVHARYR